MTQCFRFFKKKQAKEAVKQPPRILPRIKQQNFLASIDSLEGMTDSSRPVVEQLAGDLLLTYAVDIGDSYLMLTPAILLEHNLASDKARELAELNALSVLSEIRVRTDGTIHELTAPENMAACAILCPALWKQIEGEVGGPVIAAFPHRDAVFYAADNDQAWKHLVK